MKDLILRPLSRPRRTPKFRLFRWQIDRRLLQLDEPVEHGLLIVRPDQHVAWRGSELPQDCRLLVRYWWAGVRNRRLMKSVEH